MPVSAGGLSESEIAPVSAGGPVEEPEVSPWPKPGADIVLDFGILPDPPRGGRGVGLLNSGGELLNSGGSPLDFGGGLREVSPIKNVDRTPDVEVSREGPGISGGEDPNIGMAFGRRVTDRVLSGRVGRTTVTSEAAKSRERFVPKVGWSLRGVHDAGTAGLDAILTALTPSLFVSVSE